MEASDVNRRLAALEAGFVSRREADLMNKSVDERLKRLEDSMKWAFRMVAAAFIGFLFQGVIVLATLANKP